jgi:hypothetical protein
MSQSTLQQDHHCIEVCNQLLRGEISAVETYNKAIEKFSGEPQVTQLIHIRDEHNISVINLKENILALGGSPDDDSGAWGTFTNAVQAAANLLGDDAALYALIEGENYGRGLYEAALENEHVLAHSKSLFNEALLPRIDKHLLTLNTLKETI